MSAHAARTAYAVLASAVVALCLFAPSLGNGLAYDDESIVGMDPRVQSLAYVPEIFTRGYWSGDEDLALYRPLTTLSFAVDWSIGHGEPAWFHFSNVLMHAAATALVTLLLARFVSPIGALAGGLVFAVHPVHVEAVANVVGRAEILATILVLGACLLWLALDAAGPWRRHRIAGVTALFTLGLLTKESAVMLPPLLLLLDAARGELRSGRVREYARHNALAFLLFALAVAGFIAVRTAVLGGVTPSRVDAAFEVADSTAARVLTALQAWPVYLRLFLFPRELLADYGPRILMPADSFTRENVLGLVLLLTCVIGGPIALRGGYRVAGVALLWFPIALFPVSNLAVPIGVIVAERTLYLPSVALALGVGAAATIVAGSDRARAPLRVAGAILLVLLAGRSLARIPEWASTDRILGALVRDRPESFRGQWYFARVARNAGDTTGALQRYTHALELWPWRHRLVLETAAFAGESGRLPVARDVAQHAVRRWPDDVAAWRILAAANLDLGDTVRARAALEAGLHASPRDDILLRMIAALDSTGTAGR